MRRILYSWTYQHTLVRKGKRMGIDTCMRMPNAQARPIPHPTNNTNMCWWDAEGERRLCLQR